MSSNYNKHDYSQPAPSGHPDVNIDIERPGAERTTEKGRRKQLLINLGDDLGRQIYKIILTDPKYKEHNININDEMTVLVDYLYAAIFDEIYAARIPGYKTDKVKK